MSVVVPTTTSKRHIIGDMVVKFYDMTVTDGDTFTVPIDSIETIIITPTTNTAAGAAWAAGGSPQGTLVTFKGTWTGRVTIITRKG